MYEDYRSRSRGEGGSRPRSPPRDDRDYRRSRKDSRSPARSPHRQYPGYRDNRDYGDYHNPPDYRGADRNGGGGGYGYYPDDAPPPRRGGWRGEGVDTLHYDDRAEPEGGYREYEDRGRGRRRSYSPNSPERYGRSRSPLRREPHHTLILEGLPLDVTEDDILDGFDAFAGSSTFAQDQIRSLRLRTNKMGRRICFVEFFRTSDAEDFAERNHFTMTFDLAGAGGKELEPVRVNVNYSRVKEDGERGESRGRGNTWRCSYCPGVNYPHRSNCYKCGRDRDDSATGLMLTGESDEAPLHLPSQYLVVRDLESSVTEEVLAKGITKLFVEETNEEPAPEPPPAKKLKSTAPVKKPAKLGAKPGSLRRVFLMRDRRSDESWRYGFAEFSTLEDAQGAMAKFQALPKFTISSKLVSIGFIHTGVFVPVLDPEQLENSPPTAFVPVYNPDVSLRYWDDRPYPSILEVNVESPSGPASPGDKEKAEKSGGNQDPNSRKPKKPRDKEKDKEKEKDKDKDKVVIMAPQMQMWAKKRKELHRGQPDAEGSAEEAENFNGTSERRAFGPRAAHWKDTYTSYGSMDDLACLLCMRKFETAQDLRDHEVLSLDHDANVQVEAKKQKAIARLARSGKKPQTLIRRVPRDRSDRAPVYVSYADPDSLQCYACQRKFKNIVALRLHERESELHRRSVADSANLERTVTQLLKLGKVPIKVRPVRGDSGRSRYRDRARERRRAFNQPTKAAQKGNGTAEATTKEGGNTSKTDSKKPPLPSKGAALLSKMGWTAGQGLGADGSGRAEAIQTDLYRPGVGLGAEGGKVGDAAEQASRKTTNYYSDFVQQTKDKARERFERLG